MLVKCLQIAQKYADIFAPQLRHLPLSSPIWKEIIWKIKLKVSHSKLVGIMVTKFLT